MNLLIIVMVGGAIGAGFRHIWGKLLLTYIVKDSPFTLPMAILSVNILGCFLAGFFVAYVGKYGDLSEEWRHFITIGFLSSLTTFSALIVDVVAMIEKAQYISAITYPTLSVMLGLLAFLASSYCVKNFL